MPSPLKPAEFCTVVPSATSSLCDRLLAVFLRMPKMLCDFFTWMLNADGSLSDNFKNEAQIVPTGMILPRLSTVVPTGWLACMGQEVSRTTYAMLFSVIGTTAGAGNGTTTFNVPDLRGLCIVGYDGSRPEFDMGVTGGEEEHVLSVAEMRHFHGFGDGTEDTLVDGSFCVRPWSSGVNVGTGTHQLDTTGVPALGPAISTGRLGTSDPLAAATAADGHENMMPYIAMQYLIKT